MKITKVKTWYVKRQHIEEFFKLLRGRLRWHPCPARSLQAQVAHFHLCLLAFVVLQEEAVQQKTTVYQVRQKLFKQAVPTQTPLLQGFTSLA